MRTKLLSTKLPPPPNFAGIVACQITPREQLAVCFFFRLRAGNEVETKIVLRHPLYFCPWFTICSDLNMLQQVNSDREDLEWFGR